MCEVLTWVIGVINPILYQNQVDKYPEIYNDYQNMRTAVQGKSGGAAL